MSYGGGGIQQGPNSGNYQPHTDPRYQAAPGPAYMPPPEGAYQPPQGSYNGPAGYNGPANGLPQYSQYNPNVSKNPNEKQDFDQAFSIAKPKWNDLWAGILFLLFVAGFVAVSAISLSGYATTRGSTGTGLYDGTNRFGLSTNTIIGFIICLGIAILLSYGYVMLARAFTKQLIWITGLLNIAMGLATAIYMLYNKYYTGGIVFLVFVAILAFAFYTWIPRIPFSVVMLQTAIDVAKDYGHVYLVSFIGGMVATAFAVWFSITLVAVYARFQPGNNPNCGTNGCSNAKVIGLTVFITFTAYWISEFIKNVIHVTISGVYGSWYFAVRNFPRNATRGAFKRSMTTSFGSISLGSLIVAIINFLRQLCSMARAQSASEGNIVACVLLTCLSCLIALLDWAVQFINRYAFSHIALYGKAYIPAAKDTWKMIKDRGIDALVNECLIGPVFSIGAMFVGYACALCAYVFLRITNKNDTGSNGFTPVVIAFAFLIGLQICNIFTTPLSSGIDTIFVAAAWDPQVMINDHPELYQRMVQTYPHVAEAIHA